MALLSKSTEKKGNSKQKDIRPWLSVPELYSCLFIDLPWIDMLCALSYISSRQKYKAVQEEIEHFLGGPDQILVSLSVRSSFDLLLQAMDFSEGSELISTCINVQSMTDIAKHHGIILKGVDINLSNLQPDIAQIEAQITPKTIGIMVVQLFGYKFRMRELKKIAEKHDLILIEDCAQAFSGPQCFKEIESDFAFFSFGSIKRFSCIGGACIVSNNPDILQRMRTIQNCYSYQGRMEYFLKLAKYVLVMCLINFPFIAAVASRFVTWLGIDYKVFMKSRLRGFTGDLMKLIRYQPSLPLLLLIRRRMNKILHESSQTQNGVLKAEYALSSLIEKPVYIVGCLSEIRDFWLFPILVDNPLVVENELEKLGISAFSKASSLVLNQAPSKDIKSSVFLCNHILYLPIDRRSPKWHLDKVCRTVPLVLQKRTSILEIAEEEGVLLERDIEKFHKLSAKVTDFSGINGFKPKVLSTVI